METNVKPQPPMNNIIQRKYKADMGENFEDWANGYFSLESDHLDTYLERDVVFNEYTNYANVNRLTMQSFTKKLKAFCEYCPWVDCLNPAELCNASGRIQQRIDVTPGVKKVKDMIYLRSKEGAEIEIKEPEQNTLDFEDDTPF